mmetsp:Transcript_12478/g.37456  ORF Transcript_12478/g.37456 Transcript_12478/m.37456 type:complete len:285 (-) Transcript_12478:202-1056(-)
MLLKRLRNERLPQATLDGYLTIGPQTTRDVMSNPIVAKIYSLIHNILMRASQGRNHDTYLIDLYCKNKAPPAAFRMLGDYVPTGHMATFQVGHFSGGLLERVAGSSQNVLLTSNVCQNVMNVVNTTFKQQPHQGLCFNITSLKLITNVPTAQTHKSLVARANHFAPDTIVTEESGALTFLDPNFTLESKNLSRSAYLGHLHEGTRKGFKVYSIHRPCPTFTSYANVLIKDHRSHRKGVRLLTHPEMLKLNNFPPEVVEFLVQCGEAKANRYIANSIPTNMLYTI